MGNWGQKLDNAATMSESNSRKLAPMGVDMDEDEDDGADKKGKKKKKKGNRLPQKSCTEWCKQKPEPWTKKCKWSSCTECDACDKAMDPRCTSFCENHAQKWTTKCNWVTCKKCNV